MCVVCACNMTKLGFKKFLIELLENPRMKSTVSSIAPTAETSAFSMGEYVNNDVISATSDDIGKLKRFLPFSIKLGE